MVGVVCAEVGAVLGFFVGFGWGGGGGGGVGVWISVVFPGAPVTDC